MVETSLVVERGNHESLIARLHVIHIPIQKTNHELHSAALVKYYFGQHAIIYAGVTFKQMLLQVLSVMTRVICQQRLSEKTKKAAIILDGSR